MPNSYIINQRLDFLDFDQDTLATIKKFQKILEPSIDHMLDRFYEHAMQIPEIRAIFPTSESLKKARQGQKEHWLEILFSGDIGETHFANAEHIGQTHERIGLTLGYYLGGYCMMLNQFLRVISDHYHQDNIAMTKMLQALNKAAFLDIDSVIDSYLEAKDKAIQKVLINAEQFTESIKFINTKLAKDAILQQTQLAKLLTKTDSLNDRAQQMENKLLEHAKSASVSNPDITKLLKETAALLNEYRETTGTKLKQSDKNAALLATQLNNLNNRYDALQDEFKCHFSQTKQKSLFSKARSFFF